MEIKKFSISRDSKWYEAWPDITWTNDAKLICVFSECRHHDDRSYTRIMTATSLDNGKSWLPKMPLSEATEGEKYFYNCARIARLRSGVLAVTVDMIPSLTWETDLDSTQVMISFSHDNGTSWSPFAPTPLRGIVPDKLIELESGRLLLTAHRSKEEHLAQFLRYSDDGGKNWSEEITVAANPGLHLCEASLIPLGGNDIVALLRENTLIGLDAYKVISHDGGQSWSDPIEFPLPGCHRPNCGMLRDGNVLITYRFLPCRDSQSFFGALTTRESLLATERVKMKARIFQIDYDRAKRQDTGYSGFAELPDGNVYIVNYIVDDMLDRGQIRGYRLDPKELIFPVPADAKKLVANQ